MRIFAVRFEVGSLSSASACGVGSAMAAQLSERRAEWEEWERDGEPVTTVRETQKRRWERLRGNDQ